MPEIQPIVSDVSIGNATVAIGCVWLKCVESVTIRLSMEEVPITCDWADGAVTTLRGNPTGTADIVCMNLNSTTLKYALDANVTTKAAAETVTCEEHHLNWTPDNEATPTEWTATVCVNSPEISDVTVYEDATCLVDWDSEATPDNDVAISDSCTGCILLTTDTLAQALDTVYIAYTHNIETPTGATLIKPPMSTFADDFKLHILHRNASTGDLELLKFWRAQIIPDFEAMFDNTNRVVTVPIKLRILGDRLNHPDAPLGQIILIDADDSEASDFTNSFYKKVRAHI